jgi:hypothetical protein
MYRNPDSAAPIILHGSAQLGTLHQITIQYDATPRMNGANETTSTAEPTVSMTDTHSVSVTPILSGGETTGENLLYLRIRVVQNSLNSCLERTATEYAITTRAAHQMCSPPWVVVFPSYEPLSDTRLAVAAFGAGRHALDD